MKRSDQYQEVRTLTDAVIDKQATDSQINRLKQLLAADPDAQDFYFEYVGMHTRLKDSAAHNIEFVYRRMTKEEFIMRPAGHSDEKMDDKQKQIHSIYRHIDHYLLNFHLGQNQYVLLLEKLFQPRSNPFQLFFYHFQN